ncbi:cystatin-like fold lipoprotein [Terribacillus saccharophilus]|uniref:Uncharacterized protein n=1 Tax=Terribacillus saccharophilus TaxID=361277 RepID=A0A268AAM2_9BACI|nr:cystatin-like fold lipoprotein [Terribacillus saccharophilus]PAD21171.1 hypothetical protein CHH64_09550 [Terribacillus saccharophilus]PAF17123.1 hypothetical protein CHH51_14680 [Terribacillus saccharophilus]PAF34513.1 hypothetical protein CHH69_15390 [Terribacillus saccharophilus]PAF36198.1 hypothetical protein CHH58_13505 [Terribacillus saccharophilus]
MSKQVIIFLFVALLFLAACRSDYEKEMEEVFSTEKNYAEKVYEIKIDEVNSEIAVYKFGKFISITYKPVEENEEIVGVYKRNHESGYDRMDDESGINGNEPVIRKAILID